MRKWLVVFIVFIAFAPVPAAQAADSAPTSVKVTQLPSVSVTRDCLDWLALFFSGGLVLVGIFGVIAANRTLKSIEKQVEEMKAQTAVAKTSADAAKQSADIQLRSERAWLTITSSDVDDKEMRFYWEVKNVGRSPARLIETQAIIEIAQSKVDLPETPVYGNSTCLSNRILAPGDSMKFVTCWFEKDQQQQYIPHEVNQFSRVAGNMGTYYLVAFGYVCSVYAIGASNLGLR